MVILLRNSPLKFDNCCPSFSPVLRSGFPITFRRQYQVEQRVSSEILNSLGVAFIQILHNDSPPASQWRGTFYLRQINLIIMILLELSEMSVILFDPKIYVIYHLTKYIAVLVCNFEVRNCAISTVRQEHKTFGSPCFLTPAYWNMFSVLDMYSLVFRSLSIFLFLSTLFILSFPSPLPVILTPSNPPRPLPTAMTCHWFRQDWTLSVSALVICVYYDHLCPDVKAVFTIIFGHVIGDCREECVISGSRRL